MKKIEAKIRKSKFKEVKKNLIKEGFDSFNYHLTRCISKESEKRFYRGVEFDSKSSDRIDFTIYVKNNDVDQVLNIIKESGITGDAYDSLIAVFGIEQSYVLRHVDGEDKLIHKI
jgi:nitrogen regulatory protein P-II 1